MTRQNMDPEDLWTDYRTERNVTAGEREAFLAGVAAGRRTAAAPLAKGEARAVTPITHVEVNGALRAIHAQAEKVDALTRQRRESHGAGVLSTRQAGRAEGLREAASILSRCHDAEAERYRGDIPADVRPTYEKTPLAVVLSYDLGRDVTEQVNVPACNVDHTNDKRPAVLGGECSACFHRPPLHEATCPKARCEHKETT